MLKDNLRTRERARLCGKLKLLLSELSLPADHYAVCVSAICFLAVLEANLHLSNLSKYFTYKIILKTVVFKKEIVKFDNSVSVVKSQCYSNANQIELVL